MCVRLYLGINYFSFVSYTKDDLLLNILFSVFELL